MPLTRDWVEAAADLAVTASGGHRTGTACPPKKAVREAASRLFHQPHASSSRAARRATLDRTTGSEPNGSGPTGAGCLPSQFEIPRRHGRTGSGHPRPATSRAAKAWIPGSSPGMTARELESPQWRSRIVQRVKRRKPSPPLWGRVGEGGVSANRSGSGASTPLPGPPPQGGRGIVPHWLHDPALPCAVPASR